MNALHQLFCVFFSFRHFHHPRNLLFDQVRSHIYICKAAGIAHNVVFREHQDQDIHQTDGNTSYFGDVYFQIYEIVLLMVQHFYFLFG